MRTPHAQKGPVHPNTIEPTVPLGLLASEWQGFVDRNAHRLGWEQKLKAPEVDRVPTVGARWWRFLERSNVAEVSSSKALGAFVQPFQTTNKDPRVAGRIVRQIVLPWTDGVIAMRAAEAEPLEALRPPVALQPVIAPARPVPAVAPKFPALRSVPSFPPLSPEFMRFTHARDALITLFVRSCEADLRDLLAVPRQSIDLVNKGRHLRITLKDDSTIRIAAKHFELLLAMEDALVAGGALAKHWSRQHVTLFSSPPALRPMIVAEGTVGLVSDSIFLHEQNRLLTQAIRKGCSFGDLRTATLWELPKLLKGKVPQDVVTRFMKARHAFPFAVPHSAPSQAFLDHLGRELV